MGRRIFSSLLAMALIFSLPVFSLADGGEVTLKDSGSPEVSLMALRSIASDDGISLAAAEGNSGQFGYNIEPYSVDFVPTLGAVTSSLFNYGVVLNLPAGSYGFNIGFNAPFTRLRIMDMSDSSYPYIFSVEASELSETFTIDSPKQLYILGTFRLSDISTDAISVTDFGLSRLLPVEGFSSGYSHSEVFHSSRLRYDIQTVSWDFGNVPAGNYLINVYVDSIFSDFDFSIKSGNRYLSFYNLDGVSSSVVSHSGGNLVLDGSYVAFPIYDISSVTSTGSYSEYNGSGTFISTDVYESDWGYYITDVVAVPLEGSGLEQFGIFGSIVGYFRDEFSSLKSFLTDKFNKDEDAYTGATSPELSEDINSASSMIDIEDKFVSDLNNQIIAQGSNVDPETVINNISGAVDVFSSMIWVSSIISSSIDGIGIFQFIIFIPMVLGIVCLVIGRGASILSRRPQSSSRPVKLSKGE